MNSHLKTYRGYHKIAERWIEVECVSLRQAYFLHCSSLSQIHEISGGKSK